MNELVDFIKKSLSQGMGEEEIRNMLLNQGWTETQINDGFERTKIPTPPAPGFIAPKPPTDNTNHLTMWDSFQNILMFISLYVMATSIVIILNLYIDRWVPPLNQMYNYYFDSFSNTTFSASAAALLVSFPFFAYFFLETTRRQKKFPEIANLKSRKILIYITLVITFIVMLINLITTVFQLLSGNISLNFVLHFLVTVFVAGIIFFYYLRQVRNNRQIHA